ncbi:Protein RnfH [bioreactor metagenome]|uniref:Protein RnfH n=1 Tax=bioreactor metagenome TaxID=1076179 RepID=A0A645EUZ4_9ZZZZ
MADPAAKTLNVTVVTSAAPGQTQEWAVQLPTGATAREALAACGLDASDAAYALSVWGRSVQPQRRLHDLDRVEWCRALKVDPKVARRERFASQGSRGAGLFSKRRPGAKSGY